MFAFNIVDPCPVSFYYKAKVYCLPSRASLKVIYSKYSLNYQESKDRSEHVFDQFLWKEARFELKLGFVIVTNETLAHFVLLYKVVLWSPA